jgi:ubiquinone/menaquinone biosynthesis C-methylase UbiE
MQPTHRRQSPICHGTALACCASHREAASIFPRSAVGLFERFQITVQLNNYPSRNDVFVRWIIASTPPGCSILDVGASDGAFCPQISLIAKHAARLAGVDPDAFKLSQNRFISERYPTALEDTQLPAGSFDAIYCFFVLEHVADEQRFLKAAAHILKPGGSLFFMTPNGNHYFSILAFCLERLGLQKRALGLLTGGKGEEWHHPAVYRMNTPKAIERAGRKYGFDRFEYHYCERFDEVAGYFPGPAKVLPWLWEGVARVTRQEKLLVTFFGRIIKETHPAPAHGASAPTSVGQHAL